MVSVGSGIKFIGLPFAPDKLQSHHRHPSQAERQKNTD